MKPKLVLAIAIFFISLFAGLIFLISMYVQPILPPSINTTLLLAVAALVGAASFLAALNETYDLFSKLLFHVKKSSQLSSSITEQSILNKPKEVMQTFGDVNDVNGEVIKNTRHNCALAVKVFISYSPYDELFAEKLYNIIAKIGANPWIDKHSITPGKNREYEIHQAIRETNYFLACFSTNSFDKKGHIHKEIKIALDILDQLPEGDVFIIPVRFDECDIPDRLAIYQPVNLYEHDGMDKLLLSLSRSEC